MVLGVLDTIPMYSLGLIILYCSMVARPLLLCVILYSMPVPLRLVLAVLRLVVVYVCVCRLLLVDCCVTVPPHVVTVVTPPSELLVWAPLELALCLLRHQSCLVMVVVAAA